MKNVPDIIEKRIAGGLVIDVRGNWVPIADKVEHERTFLLHLEAGEVLLERKWVSIGDAKRQQSFLSTSSFPVSDPFLSVGAYTELEETRDLASKKFDKGKPELNTNNQHNIDNSQNNSFVFSDVEIDEETRTIDIKRSTTDTFQNNDQSSEYNDDYLEETMSFDMKAILNSSREPVGRFTESKSRSDNKEVLGEIVDKWEFEQKRKIVLVFAISSTIALFAIAGAFVLGFVL